MPAFSLRSQIDNRRLLLNFAVGGVNVIINSLIHSKLYEPLGPLGECNLTAVSQTSFRLNASALICIAVKIKNKQQICFHSANPSQGCNFLGRLSIKSKLE